MSVTWNQNVSFTFWKHVSAYVSIHSFLSRFFSYKFTVTIIPEILFPKQGDSNKYKTEKTFIKVTIFLFFNYIFFSKTNTVACNVYILKRRNMNFVCILRKEERSFPCKNTTIRKIFVFFIYICLGVLSRNWFYSESSRASKMKFFAKKFCFCIFFLLKFT